MTPTIATARDWLDLIAARGRGRASADELLVLEQVLDYPAWCYRPADRAPPVALAGIVHREHSVIWLATAPGADRLMLPMIRSLRRLVEREARLIGRPLWAQVAADNQQGGRIVSLLGFERVGDTVWRREPWRRSRACSAAAE